MEYTESQLSGLRGTLNGLGMMLLGPFLGRGLMQSQREAQLPMPFLLLQHF